MIRCRHLGVYDFLAKESPIPLSVATQTQLHIALAADVACLAVLPVALHCTFSGPGVQKLMYDLMLNQLEIVQNHPLYNGVDSVTFLFCST
mmetsp:Transcript_19654/g.46136  ORF Transcript_19654/g.46136 Transcript_19654/m.46136 type:complete len:91 (-) Transcript_19654:343-615(-)